MSDVFDEILRRAGVVPDKPTQMERMEAQVLYTALMTDTLIGEEQENV